MTNIMTYDESHRIKKVERIKKTNTKKYGWYNNNNKFNSIFRLLK